MYSITVNADDNIIKEVGKASEKIGNVYLPKDWVGRKVMVVLLPNEEEN